MKTESKSAIRQRALRIYREWLRPFIVVVIVLGTFRSAVADWNDVPTGSMKPTIVEGDRIFVNKLAYGLRFPFSEWWIAQWSDPQRGDIVVCFSPADGVRLVKRVVGVGGDKIELRNNQLFVNDEPSIYEPLDEEISAVLGDDVSSSHIFAEEHITPNAPGHAVMITPHRSSKRWFGPVEVPEGEYLLMGDNRDDSKDSRWFGFVERDAIVGRSGRVLLSVDPDRYYMPRFSRFLHRLD